MADYYTMFSFSVSVRDNNELEWWKAFINNPLDFLSQKGRWNKKKISSYELDDCDCTGVEFEFIDNSKEVWIHGDTNGNVDYVADVLQLFLKERRPKGSIGFTWACTCNKMRCDSFSGGGIQVLAKDLRVYTPYKVSTKDN